MDHNNNINTEYNSELKFFDSRACDIIVASNRQKGNPLIQYIKNTIYEFSSLVPDFLVGKYDAVIFISIKYHKLHNTYLKRRIMSLEKNYKVRVVLCMVDVSSSAGLDTTILDITNICFNTNMTLLLVWTPQEAAAVLEAMKSFENTPPDSIRGILSSDINERSIEALSSLPRINRSDACKLLKSFSSISNIINARECELVNLSGIGLIKAKVLSDVFSSPFVPE
ncbi:DNA repair protein RAD10 [Cryptosporidium andersoni]|uniref:DNA repair protein RAD10 n=1 Tax=Cryptosporidium andersoni TaxID=117008 RepID=A0A1J4MRU3_9CRYT|nr:DNA repair protein RAD10 [Cryptosporidium andersoni]